MICTPCKGSGLEDEYHVCGDCDGFGVTGGLAEAAEYASKHVDIEDAFAENAPIAEAVTEAVIETVVADTPASNDVPQETVPQDADAPVEAPADVPTEAPVDTPVSN